MNNISLVELLIRQTPPAPEFFKIDEIPVPLEIYQSINDEKLTFNSRIDAEKHCGEEWNILNQKEIQEARAINTAQKNIQWAIFYAEQVIASASTKYEDAWPKITQPAQVGAVKFGVGVSVKTVIEAAYRFHAYQNTPEKEAARIQKAIESRDKLSNLLNTEKWSPINTAPQDGTLFDVWIPKGCGYRIINCYIEDGEICTSGEDEDKLLSDIVPENHYPSHWRNVPLKPSKD